MRLETIPEDQANAIRSFYSSVEDLKTKGIIRSASIIGNIGEYIVSTVCGLTLATSGRQEGWDARDAHNKKVQIKFFSAAEGTNVFFGDPAFYDYTIVLLHPNSRLHPGGQYAEKFMLFNFSQEKIRAFTCHEKNGQKKYSCGKEPFKNGGTPLDL